MLKINHIYYIKWEWSYSPKGDLFDIREDLFKITEIAKIRYFYQPLASNYEYGLEEGSFLKSIIKTSLALKEVPVEDLPLYIYLKYMSSAFSECLKLNIYGDVKYALER